MNQPVLVDTPNSNPTRQRIIEAALSCLDHWGVAKTSLNDIAREAGVTRPTVYSYFPNKDELLHAAMLEVGNGFAKKLYRHFGQFEKPAERLLEAVMFTYRELPKEPYLGLALGNDMAQQINERAISSAESVAIRKLLFAEILQNDPDFIEDVDEISEVTTRFLLSLLLVEGPRKRTLKETRAFLERRLLPALGMHT